MTTHLSTGGAVEDNNNSNLSSSTSPPSVVAVAMVPHPAPFSGVEGGGGGGAGYASVPEVLGTTVIDEGSIGSCHCLHVVINGLQVLSCPLPMRSDSAQFLDSSVPSAHAGGSWATAAVAPPIPSFTIDAGLRRMPHDDLLRPFRVVSVPALPNLQVMEDYGKLEVCSLFYINSAASTDARFSYDEEPRPRSGGGGGGASGGGGGGGGKHPSKERGSSGSSPVSKPRGVSWTAAIVVQLRDGLPNEVICLGRIALKEVRTLARYIRGPPQWFTLVVFLDADPISFDELQCALSQTAALMCVPPTTFELPTSAGTTDAAAPSVIKTATPPPPLEALDLPQGTVVWRDYDEEELLLEVEAILREMFLVQPIPGEATRRKRAGGAMCGSSSDATAAPSVDTFGDGLESDDAGGGGASSNESNKRPSVAASHILNKLESMASYRRVVVQRYGGKLTNFLSAHPERVTVTQKHHQEARVSIADQPGMPVEPLVIPTPSQLMGAEAEVVSMIEGAVAQRDRVVGDIIQLLEGTEYVKRHWRASPAVFQRFLQSARSNTWMAVDPVHTTRVGMTEHVARCHPPATPPPAPEA